MQQKSTFTVFKDGNKVDRVAGGVGAGNLHVSESVRLMIPRRNGQHGGACR